MVTAILAVVSAAIGLVSGVISKNARNLESMRATNQARTDFARTKELTAYTNSAALIQGIILIASLGVALIALIIYLNK